jgi:hypothetical protein
VLHGRVPAERHEHYDAEGNLTGFTVVVREPEWTDEDVRQLLEQSQVDAEACPGCGWHEAVINDESVTLSPVSTVCPACAARAQYDRMLAESDEKSDADKSPKEPHAADGRWVRVAVLSPDEIEQRGGPGGDTH